MTAAAANPISEHFNRETAMRRLHRTLALATLVVAPSLLRAQSVANPEGHWEGSINVPDAPVMVVIDLAKNAKGVLAGTFTNPKGDVKGLPLGGVAAEGKTVHLVLKVPDGSGAFDGVLSDDGKSITGRYNTDEGGYSIPFTLTRTGEAKIEAAPRNPAIGKELEGTWNGTVDVNGIQKHLVLTMSNQPDGTSSGTIVNNDGAGVEIPIGVAQKGTSVTLELKVMSASYAGTVSADGTEIVGTWTQGALALQLTFTHAPKR
jgi:hypothetical protein